MDLVHLSNNQNLLNRMNLSLRHHDDMDVPKLRTFTLGKQLFRGVLERLHA